MMKTLTIGAVTVTVPEDMDEGEAKEYYARGREKYGKSLKGVYVEVEGEDALITYSTSKEPFERIRRITGYLVGTMPRWNDAKRAEEHDRVKHSIDL